MTNQRFVFLGATFLSLLVALSGCTSAETPVDASTGDAAVNGDTTTMDTTTTLDAPGSETSSSDGAIARDAARDVPIDTGRQDVFVPPNCGNGALAGPRDPYREECDDGNNVEGDGCSADCRWEGRCNAPLGLEWVGRRDGAVWLVDVPRERPDSVEVSCGPFSSGGDLVIAWTAPADGVLFVETLADTVRTDTAVALMRSCMDLRSEIACENDIGYPNELSRLAADVTAGEYYEIVIDVGNSLGEAAVSARILFAERVAAGAACDATHVCPGGHVCRGTCTDVRSMGCGDTPATDIDEFRVGREIEARVRIGPADTTTTACAPAPLADTYVRFTAPFDTRVYANARGDDNSFELRSICLDPRSEQQCNPHYATEQRRPFVPAGTVLYGVVEGAANAEATVDVTFLPVAAEGMPCRVSNATIAETIYCAEGLHCRALVRDEPGTCVTPRCGDRFAEATEECDDGNTLLGDGCNASCRFDDSCETPIDFNEVAVEAENGSLTFETASDSGRDRIEVPSCGGTFSEGAHERVFRYVPPRDGELRIRATEEEGGSFGLEEIVVRTTCEGPAEIACGGDGSVDVDVRAGVPIFFFVSDGPFNERVFVSVEYTGS